MDWTTWSRENTDPGKAVGKPEALDGLLVIDFSYGSFAGLYASSLLAEFGARVIRVEPPEGDVARKMSPFGLEIDGTGLPYIVEGRNKEHITLNLETEEGRRIARELVKKADVFIETSPPGFMEERGFGYEALKAENEGLVYLSLHTCGRRGELAEKAKSANWACYDTTAQALSGFAWTTGIPEYFEGFPEHTKVPTKMGNWIAWYAGGTFGAFAVMAALYAREFTGKGQFIDISPAEALMNLNNYALHYYHLSGKVMERPGNIEPAAHPYCYVRCKDGMVFIAGYTDQNFQALCSIIGRPDLPEKYPTVRDRTNVDNAFAIIQEIEKFTMEKTREEIVELWLSYRGPGVTVAGEVLSPDETVKFDHWYERGALVERKEEPWGDLLIQGTVAKMTETPPRIKWVCRKVGADNESVYSEFLGLSSKEVGALREKGVI
ncbi:MAG: CoA transferase [Deltaproteobacteria bacterium]|nr:MAG: CoA transferase [Deltaproteobacteria bacterium]